MKTRRLKAEERKASIMRRSKQLFARKGLHGVSVDEIARACAISPAILYQHFSSKNSLYKAVLEEFACSRDAYIDAVLAGPADFGDVLYRTMLVFVQSRIKDPDSVRIELRSLIDDDKLSETFFRNQWQGFTDYIEIALKEMIAEQAIPPVDVRVAALCYVGMVRELIIARTFGVGDGCAERPLESVVEEVHALFLRSLRLPAK
jgi:AcrR family transcriptional regulator